MKTSELAIAERYKLYANYRLGGTPALKAFAMMQDAQESKGTTVETTIKGLVSVVIGIITFGIIKDLFTNRRQIVPPTLWIESPSGETIREFRFYQGIRIIRKHGWDFAVVRPIQPPRIVSRREAIKILMFGDRANDDKA